MELGDSISSIELAQQTEMPMGWDHSFAPFWMMGQKQNRGQDSLRLILLKRLLQFPLGIFPNLVCRQIKASHDTPAAVSMEHGASPNHMWSQTLNSVVFIRAWWDFVFLVAPFVFVMGAPTGWASLGEVFPHSTSFPHGETWQWPYSSSQIHVQVVGLCCTCPLLIENFTNFQEVCLSFS
jgi:hypothetical protein